MELKKHELRDLDRLWPRSEKSADIGKRAEQIIRIHFKRKWLQCGFSKPKDGGDLRIQHGSSQLTIEIIGTADNQIAWQKLKVSSQMSHDMLCNGIPVYRVIRVFDRKPEIFVLKHNEDFQLVEEKRPASSPSR